MVEHQELVTFLASAGEISMVNNIDSSFRKSLTLSAASYFEVRVRDSLIDYVNERSFADEGVVSLLRIKAIERQYHTYFDWKNRRATPFFALFGSSFKDYMGRRLTSDVTMKMSVDAFLELGDLRNNLAHQDFAVFPLDKTVGEIYELYQQAMFFVDELPSLLRNHSANSQSRMTGLEAALSVK